MYSVHVASPDIMKTKQAGAHITGPPADPRKVVMGTVVADHDQQNPYVLYSPVEKPVNNNNQGFNNFVNTFNDWSKRADTTSRNIWHNLKLGPSIPGAACGKISLTAKAMNEGGFESFFRHNFATDKNEKLKKWFACYLSTTTGPVSGTLYVSNVRLAFCSDRPLLCKTPSGQGASSYYKVMIPLDNIGKVNTVITRENPVEKYIQIVTVDGHDFWFMGFVSFEKATHNLLKIKNNISPHTHHALG